MKKLVLSIAALVAFSFSADAQTRKGTILLGAGSDLAETKITELEISPRIGFFVQDGVAIGAIVNFSSNSSESNDDQSQAGPNKKLNNSSSTLGAFVRYYVSNNVFAELGVSNTNTSNEHLDYITKSRQVLDANNNPVKDASGNDLYAVSNKKEKFDLTSSAMDLDLGLGYTLVFKEHFALEPYVKFNLQSGTEKVYDRDINVTGAGNEDDIKNTYKVIDRDFSGTNFRLGLNFSLFF
ncbi:MAG: autotransporter domain-containing protein [Flavobacteriales bacterium]|jgi:hypothetical protein|nr:autotransporter domain-containing protein [Flavobacteriales bacterium]